MAKTSWKQVILHAQTEQEIITAYNSAVKDAEAHYRGKNNGQRGIERRTRKYAQYKNTALSRLNGTTTIAGGTVTVPTLSQVYQQLLDQGLKLTGLHQQVSTAGISSPPPSAPARDKGGMLAIAIGAGLVLFYFWKRG